MWEAGRGHLGLSRLGPSWVVRQAAECRRERGGRTGPARALSEPLPPRGYTVGTVGTAVTRGHGGKGAAFSPPNARPTRTPARVFRRSAKLAAVRPRFTTHVCGPRFRGWEAITALRDAGVSVTLHPLGTERGSRYEEDFEVGVPIGTDLSHQEFEATIRAALAGTGFRRVEAIMPGS